MLKNEPHLIGITCRCGASWSGEDRMHCGACHVTFDGIELFDAHRPDGHCVQPRALGLAATKNGVWYRPDSVARVQSRRAG